jgi:hypothetical protein
MTWGKPLALWLQLPRACYNVADSRLIPTMYTACCILSHLGTQVVPGKFQEVNCVPGRVLGWPQD